MNPRSTRATSRITITAFAAHELRTPLAGLRTQAQIAIAATETAMRDNALREIILSVG